MKIDLLNLYKSYKNLNNNYHLNWFGKSDDEGRTEDPTSKKLSESRGKGEVAKSQEINSVVMLLVGFGVIFVIFPNFYHSSKELLKIFFLNKFNIKTITDNEVSMLFRYIFIYMLKITWPIFVAGMIAGIAVNVAQLGGFLFTTEQLKLDLKKIKLDPKKFFEKVIMSKEVAFNFIKSMIKLVIVLWVAYDVLKDKIDGFLQMVELTPYNSVIFLSNVCFEIIIKTIVFLLIFAVIDYKFQAYQFKEKMKMTKQEVKDEMKQQEGDPQLKAKIREKQREAVRKRMMQEVPNADVVVRNPTHFAIALKYDTKEMTAPAVVAKGSGFLALKIIRIAEENDVPIVTDKPLARTLYSQVEIGDEIPVELYKSVSEILAYVWRLKGKVM